MTLKQIVAVCVVSSFILGTLLYWEMKLAFAFIGLAMSFAFGILDSPHFVEFASLEIIAFLMGMMLFVGFLEKNKLFEYLIGKVVAKLSRRPEILLFALLMLSIFATNIGSSATAVGNPVGVLIAIKGKLSFGDFIASAAPIIAMVLLAFLAFTAFFFRDYIKEFSEKMSSIRYREGSEEVHFSGARRNALFLLGAVFLALIFHGALEKALGLGKNSLLLGVAFFGAAIALFIERENAKSFLETRVDWWTLTFFMMLFASVGTLKYVGVTDWISNTITSSFGADTRTLTIVIMGASGILSAFLDNVLAVATFAPVVEGLATVNAGNVLWWALLFGGTLFGNLTIIGSTANIVALGLLEKNYGIRISFLEWMKYSFFVTFLTVGVAISAILIMNGLW